MSLENKIKILESKKSSNPSNNIYRVKKALDDFNINFDNITKIHVTGTNGKGSTCYYSKNLISLKYKKVGMFTSPYITIFNERIMINDDFISDRYLEKYIDLVLNNKYFEDYSFFELITFIGFKYFYDMKVDAIIIEVGIGGLYDVTNVINYDYSIITNVGMDHMDKLGNTLEEIFLNKIGIVKGNSTLITTIENFDDKIDKICNERNSNYYLLKDKDFKVNSYQQIEFEFLGNIYKLNSFAYYEIKNAILAIKLAYLIGIDISEEEFKNKLFNTYIPGRFEVILNNPFIIVDGAHNIHGINGMIESVKKIYQDKKLNVILSILKPKDMCAIVSKIKDIANNIYYYEFEDPRNYKFEEIKEKFVFITKFNYTKLNKNEIFLFTGSLHFVSYIKKNIKKHL